MSSSDRRERSERPQRPQRPPRPDRPLDSSYPPYDPSSQPISLETYVPSPHNQHRYDYFDTPDGGIPGPQQYSPTTSEPGMGFVPAMASPGITNDPESASSVSRKRSLVRPERSRIDRNHPNYHYRKHAQNHNMEVIPSTTGAGPLAEEVIHPINSQAVGSTPTEADPLEAAALTSQTDLRTGGTIKRTGTQKRERKRLSRDEAARRKAIKDAERRHRESLEQASPPSFWRFYCAVVTFWAPDAVLKCFGMPAKAQRSAWREKMGLVSIILLIATFVGFLTFGFTAIVCRQPGVRLKINHVDNSYLIAHGKAYNMAASRHPAAYGIPAGSNVLYDLPHKYGGEDISFMFQNVNGACKGLIRAKPDSGIPTDDNGNLAWYFPCVSFKQDGSSKPNFTEPPYPGHSCHTSTRARDAFYHHLRVSGDVYFTWDDIKNSSRNLVVWSNNVLDLDLLSWLNTSALVYPKFFDDLRDDPKMKGIDVSRLFQAGTDKKMVRCLAEIIRVGSVDTESLGCIASKVVLYVSLVFILAVVLAKFILACTFQWFLARGYAAPKTKIDPESRDRQREIEDWSNDIYRPAAAAINPSISERTTRRTSNFLPTTSRFTNPYVSGRGDNDTTYAGARRTRPTTMAAQSHGQTNRYHSLYGAGATLNMSQGSLAQSGGMNSIGYPSNSDADPSGMAGFVHEGVIPQPPPEWQPFGYPLAHTILLVTCYSEGEEGLRTTLDSVATTDYPNSHKTIIVVCDGMIKGKGESMSTPEIVLGMMGDFVVPPEEVQPYSYVAVASGAKRHNMAKIYAGFYDYGANSVIPLDKQQRVPMMVVVKCGTPDEAETAKPGNRGKRDSQIILMSFLQKVMFDERMTELEYEMFNGLWRITGISPDFYEIMLMVDADTKVFPDCLTHMVSAMVQDPDIMGLCGETKIANKTASWVSMIQVFEYFVSHHLSKSFESVFGGVTCLPGCFCMYRIKAPKGGQNYWVPILANPDVVEYYSENVVDTLHKKNLLLLGEDRYLSTLMLKTFPKRKQVFVPQAVCKTIVPDEFKVLLSQRRRWINSTVHNLMELVLVRDLCGTFCFSMQFVVFMELVGTVVLPAAIAFTIYVVISSIVKRPVQVIPLVLLALILGLPGVLVIVTAKRAVYILWMLVYLCALPIWNFVLPTYAYWKFDDFSWGDTRKTAGETTKKAGIEYEGEFDSSKITMKRWADFEKGVFSNLGFHAYMDVCITFSFSSSPLIFRALHLETNSLMIQNVVRSWLQSNCPSSKFDSIRQTLTIPTPTIIDAMLSVV